MSGRWKRSLIYLGFMQAKREPASAPLSAGPAGKPPILQRRPFVTLAIGLGLGVAAIVVADDPVFTRRVLFFAFPIVVCAYILPDLVIRLIKIAKGRP